MSADSPEIFHFTEENFREFGFLRDINVMNEGSSNSASPTVEGTTEWVALSEETFEPLRNVGPSPAPLLPQSGQDVDSMGSSPPSATEHLRPVLEMRYPPPPNCFPNGGRQYAVPAALVQSVAPYGFAPTGLPMPHGPPLHNRVPGIGPDSASDSCATNALASPRAPSPRVHPTFQYAHPAFRGAPIPFPAANTMPHVDLVAGQLAHAVPGISTGSYFVPRVYPGIPQTSSLTGALVYEGRVVSATPFSINAPALPGPRATAPYPARAPHDSGISTAIPTHVHTRPSEFPAPWDIEGPRATEITRPCRSSVYGHQQYSGPGNPVGAPIEWTPRLPAGHPSFDGATRQSSSGGSTQYLEATTSAGPRVCNTSDAEFDSGTRPWVSVEGAERKRKRDQARPTTQSISPTTTTDGPSFLAPTSSVGSGGISQVTRTRTSKSFPRCFEDADANRHSRPPLGPIAHPPTPAGKPSVADILTRRGPDYDNNGYECRVRCTADGGATKDAFHITDGKPGELRTHLINDHGFPRTADERRIGAKNLPIILCVWGPAGECKEVVRVDQMAAHIAKGHLRSHWQKCTYCDTLFEPTGCAYEQHFAGCQGYLKPVVDAPTGFGWARAGEPPAKRRRCEDTR
ncbi:hypothetical protein DFH07DRAFT_945770 [Mycena maculata]|uniref:Uncharacterized protein n=1 Tax=Mycena maculata TaxID=230809 RepID=A0AAD7MR42_9AGAR|nr:hypothetical protein DFH07DRAFT_945770 [Mycena maculata]